MAGHNAQNGTRSGVRLAAAFEPFRRAVTSPANPAEHGVDLGQLSGEDSDLDSLPRLPHLRSISEPAAPSGRTLFAALDFVDSALPFAGPRKDVVKQPSPLLNLLLCTVSLAAGCLVPAVVDFSRTATALGPGGARIERLPPYTALSVLRAESAFNVLLGLVMIAVRRPAGGFEPLFRGTLHYAMLPLTLVYCLGDIATLCAIGHGGGPLYVAISNSRLLFAAAASQALLGRRQSRRQWLLLAEISAATAAYTVLSAGDRDRSHGGSSGGSEARAAAGVLWAVAKAFLSGTAAVLTESRYKRLNIWHANTLLKAQSLAVALVTSAIYALAVEETPVCGDAEPIRGWCLNHRGWDKWTWAVLLTEIGTGWISVAVLTRMSAITKFVCKTATAPSLYLLYCLSGFGGIRFRAPCFAAVALLVAGILAYAAEPRPEDSRSGSKEAWVGNYAGPTTPARRSG